jgi:hypothetical protein
MKNRLPLLILAIAFAFGSGFVTRGLTQSERAAVIADLRGFADTNYAWAEYYSRTPQEFGWYWGQGEGLDRAASYLEAYETSGIRRPSAAPRQEP